MGRIAEALRANLRDLAQADARMLRELDGELADGLDGLGVRELKALCKQRNLKGYSSLGKAALLKRLRTATEAQPSANPAKSLAASPAPAGLEARLDRMEALLGRIAAHLGIS